MNLNNRRLRHEARALLRDLRDEAPEAAHYFGCLAEVDARRRARVERLAALLWLDVVSPGVAA